MTAQQRSQRFSSPLARATATSTKPGTDRLTEISGRVVPYLSPTNLGYCTEIVQPGAFRASIRRAVRGIPLLLLHDSGSVDAILGRALPDDFTEARDGLHARFTLNDTDAAQHAARLARDGGLGYFSVGFQPVDLRERFDRTTDELIVELHEGRLMEVSLVSTPAYADATIDEVRHHQAVEPEAVHAATVNLCAGDTTTARRAYAALRSPGLTPRQLDALASAFLRWAPHGPRYVRHAIRQALSVDGTRLDPVALVQLHQALTNVDDTPDQRTASAARIRADYGLTPSAAAARTATQTLPARRRRR